MRRGRAPCCDKAGLKKGPWTPAEDMRLMAYIHKYGHGNWRALPKQAGLLRCGKSCRLRWINYLRPDLKRGNFTQEEEEIIIKLHGLLGNKWSKIAARLPGRTDNEIKNVWNTHLKKRAPSKGPKESLSSSSSKSSPWDACGNQCESAGQDEQVHPTVGSEGDRETGDAECLEKKQKPLEETIEITIEPSIDIWEIIEDSSAMSLDPIYGKDENTWDIQLKEEKFGSKDGGSKESSSSSISNGSWPMQVEVIEPEGKAHPQLKSERRSDCHDMGHKEMQHDPFGLLPEIPIDPNLHIWNILDDGQSLKVPPLIVPTDMDGAHHSIKDTANEESRGEGGNERWISYLEKELELWGPAYEHHRSLPTIEPFYPCPYYDPKLATDEVDPIIAYFQMQPPSPPIFSL